MAKRKSMKKDAYWHGIAQLALSNGLKPAQVGRLIKEVFPETEVNGRHIGAYKRRLIDAGVIEKTTPTVGSVGELIQLSETLVSDC